MENISDQTPIVVTGGDTGHGEIVRGDVLLIHYEEAVASRDYAYEVFSDAIAADAPVAVIDSLVDIITSDHGEPVEPRFMTREARLEELEGYQDRSERELRELAYLKRNPDKTPADFHIPRATR